jgi:exopolyphosphatase/guanosine-5'-triphosphate,3'-diphosphate pyrophosphatase
VSKQPRRAVIDIGSNTIRMVVYGGAARAPVPLFNEKIAAGLGRGVVADGRIDAESMTVALRGLARFAALTRLMAPVDLRVAATAAVRDAANGPELLARVRELGLAAELLSGEEEANAAGFGVISTNPAATGLVADLGGGSLELVRIGGGEVLERVSLPLGAMRVAAIRAGGQGKLRRVVGELCARHGWLDQVAGARLYLVGGAWRALARVHMERAAWPLPVLDNYSFPAADARALKDHVRALGLSQLVAIPGVKQARAPQLDDAAALLAALVAVVDPAQVTVSAAGLREGLLFQALAPAQRRKDPLIEGLRHAIGGQLQRSAQDAALLAWSDGAFPDEPAAERRLRHAACLIAGTGWASKPEFRALDAEDMALHGSWLGLTHGDRAVIAMTLHIGLGGDPDNPPALLDRLAEPERLERARRWGLALRLAHRIGAGAVLAVEALPLELAGDGTLVLRLPRRVAALADAGVERRLARLARALESNLSFPPKLRLLASRAGLNGTGPLGMGKDHVASLPIPALSVQPQGSPADEREGDRL